MISIYRYEQRHKHKKSIFNLEKSNKSFREFAEMIGEEDSTMLSWKAVKARELQDNIDKLRQ